MADEQRKRYGFRRKYGYDGTRRQHLGDFTPVNQPEDRVKRDELAASMRANGWFGPPLVTDRQYLVTGSHRYAAAHDAHMKRVPMIDIRDVFTEDGRNYEEAAARHGRPTPKDYSEYASLLSELSPGTRDTYGIDTTE